MRKLKLQMQVSIDGFVAGQSGDMDWITWAMDDGFIQYVSALTEPVDTILLGRVLAEGFIPTWTSRLEDPATADSFARKMVETPKVVFTKTLETNVWRQTELAKGDLVEEVNRLKNQPGGDIVAYGGGSFVTNLIKNGLIDEYHLFVNPAVLGAGMPIFQGLEHRMAMKLVRATPLDSGIVILFYTPA